MKEEMSEFLKFVYEKNLAKDVSEAFKEYPPEEEWHKGILENAVAEESLIEYATTYEEGDLVFVKEYEYADGKKGHDHLFVIIERNTKAVPIEYLSMILSSKVEKQKYRANKLLKKDTQNNLRKDSIVKTDKIYILSFSQIVCKVGNISKELVEAYKESYAKIILKQDKYLKDKEELLNELKKGHDSIVNGDTYPFDETFEKVYNELENDNLKE